jgi:uncharacterized protein (DUF2336 family)
MGELAARRDEDDSVAGSYTDRESAVPAPSSRRITADSFRLLTARLKKSSDNVQQDLRERVDVAEQPPAAEVLRIQPSLPEPVAEDVKHSVEAEIFAPEPVLPPVEIEVAEPPVAPRAEVQTKPQPPSKARAEAHAIAMEAIAKLRKAAGVAVPELQPAPLVIEAPVAETAEHLEPIKVAKPAVSEAAQKKRKPHPFIPDLFLDEDEDEEPQPELEAPAEPIVEAFDEPKLADAEPIEAFDEPELAEAELLPIAEAPARLEEAQPQQTALPAAVHNYEESAIEYEEPLVEAMLPPIAEESEPAPVVSEAPPPFAEVDDDQDLREQNELIEDEADAVKHLHGVEVIGIGDIARAIFRNPTLAERAQYLEEAAALARQEKDAEETKEILAVEIPEAAQGAKPQVRKIKPADDPFARVIDPGVEIEQVIAPDEDAAELARSLLDMMLSNPSAGLPQERALAADALLKLVPRVPTKSLVSIVERLSIMDNPPHLLIAKLINDPRIEVAGPLLEQCNHISDQLLLKVIATGQISLQRLIARRRHLSAAISDELVSFDDPSVILTLVRNTGALISYQAFHKIAVHAAQHHEVLAPLATRSDIPAPIAFELFWHVPAELRRYLLSRFLTDSETLTKILKITNVMDGGEQSESVRFIEREKADAFVAEVHSGNADSAAALLAEMASVSEGCAQRIIADKSGEPLTIALKAIGANRAQFEEYVERLKSGDRPLLNPARQSLELQNVFEQLSFNKARVVLTYWDWAVLKSGPYSAQA